MLPYSKEFIPQSTNLPLLLLISQLYDPKTLKLDHFYLIKSVKMLQEGLGYYIIPMWSITCDINYT